MEGQTKSLHVSHVNIRLSITFLVVKLLLVEIVAAFAVTAFHTLLIYDIPQQFNFELQLFNIPLFILFVTLKSTFTIYIIMQWLNEYYEITPEFVTHRRGLFFRYEEKYPLKSILYVDVNQSVFGKFFNYGTITLSDPYAVKLLVMYQIHNPLRYARVLEEGITNQIERIHVVRGNIFEKEDQPLSVN